MSGPFKMKGNPMQRNFGSPMTQERNLLQKLAGTTSTGQKLVKSEKREDSVELANFKAEMIANREASKNNNNNDKLKKVKTKKKKNWKVSVGNKTIGNASNPDLDNSNDLENANNRMS